MYPSVMESMISGQSVFGDSNRDEFCIKFPLKKFKRIRTEGIPHEEIDATVARIIERQTTSKF